MMQQIDTRIAFYACGIDYGADAKLLLASGLDRLVWEKGHRTLKGIRGFGHAVSPCSLELRSFKFEEDRLVATSSKTLLSGGRLSKRRLLSVASQIDAVFGNDVTEQLDHHKTLIIGTDQVMDWIKKHSEIEEQDRITRSTTMLKEIQSLVSF